MAKPGTLDSKRLLKKQLQLAQLDMGSDAYPLVVVPLAREGGEA